MDSYTSMSVGFTHEQNVIANKAILNGFDELRRLEFMEAVTYPQQLLLCPGR